MSSQQLVEGFRALLGKENPRASQLDGRLGAWDRFGQPVRPFNRKIDVIRAPYDQRRSLQLSQLRLDRQSVLVIECEDEALKTSRALLTANMRSQVDLDVLIGRGLGVLICRAESTGRAVDRLVAEHRVERLAQSAGRDHFDERLECFGRPVVMSIAVGECQAPDSAGIERREDWAIPPPLSFPITSTWSNRNASSTSLSIFALVVTETS